MFNLKGGMGVALMGLIMTAIAFLLFPIVMDGTESIMGWTGSGNSTIGNFTGLENVASIAPMIIFVFVVFGSIGVTAYGGVRTAQGGKLGMAMLLALIMIAISFVVYPIVMDGANDLQTTIAASAYTYTGLSSIVGIAPLLVFVSMLFGGIGVGAYAGYKKIKGG